MDSDDLDGDLNLSDEDSGQRAQIKAARAAEVGGGGGGAAEEREQYTVEFDTNIFKVSLDCLEHKG